MSTLAKGKVRKQLIEGLPTKLRLNLDWDGACDLSADRRNCIIHRALLHKEEITRPTVGVNKVTFIWRGDARIEVKPDAYALRELLRNDEAAQGQREWPAGQQVLYLPLADFKVYDLRSARNRERERKQLDPLAAARKLASQQQWQADNPEVVRKAKADYKARQKKVTRTKRERGRFVLS